MSFLMIRLHLPSKEGRTIHLQLCTLTFALCKGEISRSVKGWRDLTCMSQKCQVKMSLTSKEVHEVCGDIAIGRKDLADTRGTRRAWGTCRSLCSVRHQVLENTSACGLKMSFERSSGRTVAAC